MQTEATALWTLHLSLHFDYHSCTEAETQVQLVDSRKCVYSIFDVSDRSVLECFRSDFWFTARFRRSKFGQ